MPARCRGSMGARLPPLPLWAPLLEDCRQWHGWFTNLVRAAQCATPSGRMTATPIVRPHVSAERLCVEQCKFTMMGLRKCECEYTH